MAERVSDELLDAMVARLAGVTDGKSEGVSLDKANTIRIVDLLTGLRAERDALREACEGLAAKWEQDAAAAVRPGVLKSADKEAAYDQCAIDLRAVLARLQEE